MPLALWNEDGEQLEFWWDAEPFYGQPVFAKGGKEIGVLHIGHQSGDVVGVEIHASAIMNPVPRYEPPTCKDLREYILTHKAGPFSPSAFYNRLGDQVEFYWENERAFAENIHGDGCIVGVREIGMESKKVVGVKIFGMKKLMEQH